MPNIKRLKDLVKVLREVERKNLGFDMGKWADTGSCGTTCCAAGHHALSKLGQDEGLGLLQLSGEAGIIESPEQIQKQRRYSPVFNGKHDTHALPALACDQAGDRVFPGGRETNEGETGLSPLYAE